MSHSTHIQVWQSGPALRVTTFQTNSVAIPEPLRIIRIEVLADKTCYVHIFDQIDPPAPGDRPVWRSIANKGFVDVIDFGGIADQAFRDGVEIDHGLIVALSDDPDVYVPSAAVANFQGILRVGSLS